MRLINYNSGSIANKFISILKCLFLLLTGVGLLRLLVEAQAVDNQLRAEGNLPILRNPYGDSRFCGQGKISMPRSSNECHELERERQSNSRTHTLDTSANCIRKMSKASKKCFQKAVEDGANALIKGRRDEFNNIMNCWPVADRKKFHDDVLVKAKQKGFTTQSTMQPYDPEYTPKNNYEKLIRGPYRRDKLHAEMGREEMLNEEGRRNIL